MRRWGLAVALGGVEPASCYPTVAGSIPLVYMFEVSSGEILNPKTAPDVPALYECMHELL